MEIENHKIQEEMERDLAEINRNENRVNETLEKTNHNTSRRE